MQLPRPLEENEVILAIEQSNDLHLEIEQSVEADLHEEVEPISCHDAAAGVNRDPSHHSEQQLPAVCEVGYNESLEVGYNESLESFRYSVLVVEDDNVQRMLLTKILMRKKITCMSAANGQQALDLVVNGAKFRLILTDLQMPILDGISMALELGSAV
ncbi:hypothetical protein CYMTET_17728 [Cymbomonas tetramitiformis]|uniref:Response regulatory domain-containing protein n=1 Tax=Cymbomonas tetramitiformis TaxID=36881 RepID=A0AAE0G9I9_9CHLO|nr:hypothetical protein CYMTET_17728 [Cymbomonas tetramitiformis]